jgi:hypothetical protein
MMESDFSRFTHHIFIEHLFYMPDTGVGSGLQQWKKKGNPQGASTPLNPGRAGPFLKKDNL